MHSASARPAVPPAAGRGASARFSWQGALRRLAGLAIAGLVLFHLLLFARRIADASLAHPEVLLKWLSAGLLGAAGVALHRQGRSLVRGRSGLVFWMLVLLLHVGLASGLPPGETSGPATSELLLLLPIAAFSFSALGPARGTSRRSGTSPTLHLGGRRLLAFHPAPVPASAGVGPARFSPRPPPCS